MPVRAHCSRLQLALLAAAAATALSGGAEVSSRSSPTPWQPSAKCQVVADAWCNNGSTARAPGKSCFDIISKRGCDGPMLARKSGPGGHPENRWRCYSPKTLTPDHKHYNKTEQDDHCYCSLSAEIRAVLAKCGSPDPTPAPPAPPAPTPVPPPAPGGVKIFTSGQEGYHTFRIPAIVSHPTNHSRLLCFCEGRKYSSADHDWNDIVVKTSEDAGLTWSALRVVHSESTPKQHVTIGNPSPISLHTQPGKVVLVGCRNNFDVFAMTSEDFGATWGKIAYIPKANAAGWKFVATGPPQGIQLRSGRLLVACDHMDGDNKASHAMFSDDGGRTWDLSGIGSDVGSGNECQVLELPNGTQGHTDGTLMMNSRFEPTQGHTVPSRLISYSTSAGRTWTAGKSATIGDLVTYAGDSCEGSSITAGPATSPLLLFSTPYHKTERRNMTVFSSHDAGLSWQVFEHVDNGGSAYSALIALNDSYAGLVYESGAYSALTFRTLRLKKDDATKHE